MQLLPLIAWVINITLSFALPKNITLYKVWFKQKPLTNLSIYKGELCCYCFKRAKEEGECDKNKNSDKGSSENRGKSEKESNIKEEQEKDCFIDKDFEQEEAREEMILFKLIKRVAKCIKK